MNRTFKSLPTDVQTALLAYRTTNGLEMPPAVEDAFNHYEKILTIYENWKRTPRAARDAGVITLAYELDLKL